MKQHIAKPFIKWVGGKGQLISTFETLLPYNFSKIEDVTYIEPFVGGGAMFFYMLQRFPNIKKAIINDVNPNLVKAYSVVRDTPGALIQVLSEIQKEYLSISEEDKRKEFYLCVRKRFNEECLSDV
ncbi:MAG: DNA adenine methylase, partial [Bacteroidaceae bacterium]